MNITIGERACLHDASVLLSLELALLLELNLRDPVRKFDQFRKSGHQPKALVNITLDPLSTWKMNHEVGKMFAVRLRGWCCSLTCLIALVDFCKQKLDDPLRKTNIKAMQAIRPRSGVNIKVGKRPQTVLQVH